MRWGPLHSTRILLQNVIDDFDMSSIGYWIFKVKIYTRGLLYLCTSSCVYVRTSIFDKYCQILTFGEFIGCMNLFSQATHLSYITCYFFFFLDEVHCCIFWECLYYHLFYSVFYDWYHNNVNIIRFHPFCLDNSIPSLITKESIPYSSNNDSVPSFVRRPLNHYKTWNLAT